MKNCYANPNKEHYAGESELNTERGVFHCSGLMKPYVRGKVLDIGAGQGHMTDALVRDNPSVGDVLCLDCSDYHKRILEEKSYKFRAVDLDVYPYIKGKERFDTVLSCDVIEHLLSPYLHLVECYRLLQPGGYLILSTPQASKTGPSVPHLYYFSPEGIDLLMRRVGFKDIRRIYNGVLGRRLTELTSRLPVVRDIVNKGCYFVARK